VCQQIGLAATEGGIHRPQLELRWRGVAQVLHVGPQLCALADKQIDACGRDADAGLEVDTATIHRKKGYFLNASVHGQLAGEWGDGWQYSGGGDFGY
jgi:hypothetical protein